MAERWDPTRRPPVMRTTADEVSPKGDGVSVTDAMKEFLCWRADVDNDGLLDTFDLALGFYYGRFPKRRHQLACDFAAKAREIADGREIAARKDRGL